MRKTFFNYNKPAQQILQDLIFAANGFMLPDTGVTYGVPVAITSPQGRYSTLNSAIKVSIPYQPGAQYWGEKTFFYSRMDLANITAACNAMPIVVASYPTDTYTLLPQINAYYALQLSQADVENTVYENSAQSFIMTAQTTSLIFIDAVNFTASVSGATGITSDGTGSDGSSGSGGSSDGSSGSDGSGSGSSDGSSSGSGSSGSGSDGTSGQGDGGESSGTPTDGTSPDLGPIWCPDGESGAQAGP
jgi:hypothetical protein